MENMLRAKCGGTGDLLLVHILVRGWSSPPPPWEQRGLPGSSSSSSASLASGEEGGSLQAGFHRQLRQTPSVRGQPQLPAG